VKASLARGDPKQFFPTAKPKAKATIPSGKGKLPRRDVGLTFPNGKLVDEKIDFNQWPSITAFRAWKLSIKKKVAAASRYSQEAFAWITEVENALAFEDLEDSGPEAWQNQLDAKISAEIDKILSGEFRKQVQIQETALSNAGKMIKGRQVLWMIYKELSYLTCMVVGHTLIATM